MVWVSKPLPGVRTTVCSPAGVIVRRLAPVWVPLYIVANVRGLPAARWANGRICIILTVILTRHNYEANKGTGKLAHNIFPCFSRRYIRRYLASCWVSREMSRLERLPAISQYYYYLVLFTSSLGIISRTFQISILQSHSHSDGSLSNYKVSHYTASAGISTPPADWVQFYV